MFFLFLPMRMFLVQMNIWTSRLHKDSPHQSGWASFNPLRTPLTKKRKKKPTLNQKTERVNLVSLSYLVHPSFLALGHWSTVACRVQIIGFLVLHNHMNQLPLYICVWLNTHTHTIFHWFFLSDQYRNEIISLVVYLRMIIPVVVLEIKVNH